MDPTKLAAIVTACLRAVEQKKNEATANLLRMEGAADGIMFLQQEILAAQAAAQPADPADPQGASNGTTSTASAPAGESPIAIVPAT